MFYIHKDYLGSFETVTNGMGEVVEKLSFDPWGRRRNPLNWTYEDSPFQQTFDRGYTGHQHLDIFGLVNMNGRVYDPWLGRMLSPDPFLQSPGNSQNYNRYTYALNNPLKYIDPSGYHYMEQWDRPVARYVFNASLNLTNYPSQGVGKAGGYRYNSHTGYYHDSRGNIVGYQTAINWARNTYGSNSGYSFGTLGEFGNYMAENYSETSIAGTKYEPWKLKVKMNTTGYYYTLNTKTGKFYIMGTDIEIDPLTDHSNDKLSVGQAGGGEMIDFESITTSSASAVSFATGVISNTLSSTRIGSNIAHSLSNSKAFLTSVKYLKPIGYWASGFGIGTDVIMSFDGSQTWTETGINTAVTGIAIGVGGWPGLIIQGNYQASKAYMNTISKHPEWILPAGYHSFYH